MMIVSSLAAVSITAGISVAGKLLVVPPRWEVDIGSFVGLVLVLSSVTGLIVPAVGKVLFPLAHVSPTAPRLVSSTAMAVSIALASPLTDLVSAVGRQVTSSSVDALGSALQFLLIFAISATGRLTPVTVMSCIATANLVQTGLALNGLRGVGRLWPRASRIAWSRLIRHGLRALPLTLGNTATYRLDRYLVGLFMDASAVGLYSVAETAAEVVRLVPFSAGQVLLFQVVSGATPLRDARRSAARYLMLSAAVGLVAAGLAPLLIETVFGPAYKPAVRSLQVLFVAEIPMSAFLLDQTLLAATGHLNRASRNACLGLAAVTAGDLLLIPYSGIVGASIASLTGYLILAAVSRRDIARASPLTV